MDPRRISILAAMSILLAMPVQGGTFDEFILTDQTPAAPLANPVPGGYQPRYISGFGLDSTFTVFFEDRDLGGRISWVSTTTGAEGFETTPVATNITDTHFVVKDWPITIGATTCAYRAWASVGNNANHNFYFSNDLSVWTLVSTFTIPNAASYYPHHFPCGVHGVCALSRNCRHCFSSDSILRDGNG